ncbi:MAG: RluA family pseudouridine synthase [Leptospiraceae bacterium]|nr:RluA family pseudouridine synthase [Leptospiraceae bacterium]MCP5512968.1 RluA family pseudouridine synthase [Leptospiraceae bacterium]
MILSFIVKQDEESKRLDQFLYSSTGEEISRTSVQKWIESGHVFCKNGSEKIKSNRKIKPGEIYEIHIPPRPKLSLDPIPMDLSILYEDEDMVIIDKPQGLASHGGPEDARPSLVNGLLYHFKNLSGVGGEIRPGIVHRLDKPTSGVMVIAKNDKTHIALSKQFQNRSVKKTYFAWLVQTPNLPTGRIAESISRHPTERLKMHIDPRGRKAITNYKVVKTINSKKGRNYTLVEVNIETGRTHQIRVHFQFLRCPIVGDLLYSRSAKEFSKFGLLLFSQRLSIFHPGTHKEIDIQLPFPERFQRFEEEAKFY